MKNPEQEQITAELFSDWASSDRAENMASGHEPLVGSVLRSWQLNEHTRVLDIGCGVGRGLEAALKAGAGQVAGIDLSGKMIEAATARLPDADLQTGSVLELPWEDSCFTHVMSIETLYYIDEPVNALNEIHRVLGSHGHFSSVIEYFKENQASQLWSETLPMKITNWTERKWQDAFKDTGFRNVTTKRIVRKDFKKEAEFAPSKSFPNYEMYFDYIKQGALWVQGEI